MIEHIHKLKPECSSVGDKAVREWSSDIISVRLALVSARARAMRWGFLEKRESARATPETETDLRLIWKLVAPREDTPVLGVCILSGQ
jgi:hypothetical protein